MAQVNDHWMVALDLPAADSVEYKFLAGPEWALGEDVPMECGVSNGLGGYKPHAGAGRCGFGSRRLFW